jgi:CRP-like cAMP-binding protein
MSEKTDIVETLRKAQLFVGVAERTLEKIGAISKLRDFDEGDVIYQLGDDAEEIYVLKSGRVRFTLGVANRPDSGHSIMTSRMVFGWASLIDEARRRVATAVCLEPSTVVAIPGAQLLQILEKDPAAGFLVMRRIAAMVARNFLEVRHE